MRAMPTKKRGKSIDKEVLKNRLRSVELERKIGKSLEIQAQLLKKETAESKRAMTELVCAFKRANDVHMSQTQQMLGRLQFGGQENLDIEPRDPEMSTIGTRPIGHSDYMKNDTVSLSLQHSKTKTSVESDLPNRLNLGSSTVKKQYPVHDSTTLLVS